MILNRYFSLGFIIANLYSCPVVGQKQLREANELFAKLAYTDAISKFRQFLEKDSGSYEAKQKLAECYRLTGNYAEAENWYKRIVINERSTNTDRFHYGEMLMNNGKYGEAAKWLGISAAEEPGDIRSKNYLAAIKTINRFFYDSMNFKISLFAGNGPGNDFSPILFQNTLVFTSSSDTKAKVSRHSWTGQSYTNVMILDPSSNTVEPFAPEVKSKYNNGPVSFSNAGDMYSTINVVNVENSKKDIFKLNIAHTKFDGKKWKRTEEFPFNSTTYNTAHPSVDAEGNEMYFSSDMFGGEGGMDLYYTKKENGVWSTPLNLGKDVNTPGNEIFPFLSADGKLYFSSNGHEGQGGLDILVSGKVDGKWQKPVALTYPLNTHFDDFSFAIDDTNTSGYFSSNRNGGRGGDDIYKFEYTPSYITGRVVDEAGKVVGNAVIEIEAETGMRNSITTDDTGSFSFLVSGCNEYMIRASNKEFLAIEKVINTKCARSGINNITIVLFRPKLAFNVINKYTSEKIEKAKLQIRDAQSDELVDEGLADTLKVSVRPCKDYLIISSNEGLKQTKSFYKTACNVRDEVATIAIGNPPVDPTLIAGSVFEQSTDKPLDSAAIIVFDKYNKPIVTLTTTYGGQFALAGIKDVERLVFFKGGYFSVTKVLGDEKNKREITVQMPRLELDKVIQLEGILYDIGKFNIRADAARVLDNVVKVMQENPTLEIELSAHTDARGNDQSNLALSDKRAKAAAEYIISKGISEARIIGKGYGETRLKNKCTNEVKCRENEHQENRRTEVKITKY